MPEITLSIPEDAYKKVKEHEEVRWNEVIKDAIIEYIWRLEKQELEVKTEEVARRSQRGSERIS